MNKELTPLEVSKQLKDFVLEFVKNGLDRRFIIGSFDIIETALKEYQRLKIDYDELNDIHDKIVKHKNKERDDVVKKLKALKIITQRHFVFYDNKHEVWLGNELITDIKEEYELLKEMLK